MDDYPRFYVVDAEGRLVRPRKRMKVAAVRPKQVWVLPRPENPVGATLKNLEKLEDAIFESAKFRKKFFEVYNEQEEEISATPEKYINKSRKFRTLVYCWEILNWRPNNKANNVLIKNPNNKYIK